MRMIGSVLSIDASKCNAALFDESSRAFKLSYHQLKPWMTEFVLNQSLLNGVMSAVLAEPLDSIRSEKSFWSWRKGFFGRCVDLVRSGVGFLGHGLNLFRCGQNYFRRGLNLFRDGPNLFVSDKTKSVVDQTFSASDKTISVADLTFSMTDKTFSSGRKLFPSRTKLIRSRTKVIRHRTKLSPCQTKPFPSRTKLFASRTKLFPSRTKLSPSRTKPFPCLMKSRSLGFNLSESTLLSCSPVAGSERSAGWGGSVRSSPEILASLPPSTPFTLTGACTQTRQPKQHHG